MSETDHSREQNLKNSLATDPNQQLGELTEWLAHNAENKKLRKKQKKFEAERRGLLTLRLELKNAELRRQAELRKVPAASWMANQPGTNVDDSQPSPASSKRSPSLGSFVPASRYRPSKLNALKDLIVENENAENEFFVARVEKGHPGLSFDMDITSDILCSVFLWTL
ncbi:hypothetical protein BC830DRAFT_1167415 [Chytriomyces sp. MP71]|nr:hypothetical protein BC830DRAFT_1167415 [Chytriomyces sp. MP71]